MIVNLKMNSNALRYSIMSSLCMLLITCGGDSDLSVHQDIEKYSNGNTKVHVRFHPENNVLERHISEPSGQVISVEFDSLLKNVDFQKFLEGKWTVDKQVYGVDTLFTTTAESDSAMVIVNTPESMEYTFSKDSLFINGSLYTGAYSIKYLDSLSIKIKGSWEFDTQGSDTYRKISMDQSDTLRILSYSKFVWTNHFSSPKKDNEITFYRLLSSQ